MDKIILITTPLYYVNADPHIGHAYTQVAADTLARYHRLKGRKVHLLTGTDEHGQKISRAASEKKVSPEDFVEAGAEKFKALWKKLNVKYDRFIRTTEPIHVKTVKRVLSDLYQKKFIYKGRYSGKYCVPCESFCSPDQEKKGVCPDCGRKLEEISQESYFFKLSLFRDSILNHIDKNPDFIMPRSRKNEIKGFLAGELRDLSISRLDVDWGIKLPFDPGHTAYVWVDALLNYISALGYLEDWEYFQTLWPPDIQFIGKDILKFHAVIWPAMLMALGINQPKTVFAHGWWTAGGEKMSKSLGNVVVPDEVVDRWGVDAFRYYLLRQVTFGQDGNFSEDGFKERYESELANELGNLLSRVVAMIKKYKVQFSSSSSGGFKKKTLNIVSGLDDLYMKAEFSRVLDGIWELIRGANVYIEESKPWVLAKSDEGKLQEVLSELFCLLQAVAGLIYPFMPRASKKMFESLGVEPSSPESVEWERGQDFKKIEKGEALFPKK